MSKLHDDLINEVESSESVSEGVDSLMRAIADRIEGCNGNHVKLSDLCTILREDPAKVSDALVANTDVAKVNKTRTTGYDAPSSVFDKPREGVRWACRCPRTIIGISNSRRTRTRKPSASRSGVNRRCATAAAS
jgi:hypothetical protein